jgi:hypothetical protein
MKKVVLLCAAMLLAIFAKAQDIVVYNYSCQPIGFVIFADPGCGTLANSNQYFLPVGGAIRMSMFPSGPLNPVTWAGAPPPVGSQFTVVKIFDPVFAWGNFVARPCFGPNAFGPQPGCGAQATSTWPAAGLVSVNIF